MHVIVLHLHRQRSWNVVCGVSPVKQYVYGSHSTAVRIEDAKMNHFLSESPGAADRDNNHPPRTSQNVDIRLGILSRRQRTKKYWYKTLGHS